MAGAFPAASGAQTKNSNNRSTHLVRIYVRGAIFAFCWLIVHGNLDAPTFERNIDSGVGEGRRSQERLSAIGKGKIL